MGSKDAQAVGTSSELNGRTSSIRRRARGDPASGSVRGSRRRLSRPNVAPAEFMRVIGAGGFRRRPGPPRIQLIRWRSPIVRGPERQARTFCPAFNCNLPASIEEFYLVATCRLSSAPIRLLGMKLRPRRRRFPTRLVRQELGLPRRRLCDAHRVEDRAQVGYDIDIFVPSNCSRVSRQPAGWVTRAIRMISMAHALKFSERCIHS